MNLWIAKLSLILKLQYRFSSLEMISYSILHIYKTAWYKTNAKCYVKMDNWFAILPEPWPIFLLKYVLYTFYWLISYISLHILNPWIIVLGHIYITKKYDFSPEFGIFGCNKQGSDFLELSHMRMVWTSVMIHSLISDGLSN